MSLTLIIVIITSLLSYQAFNNRDMHYKMQHRPYEEAHNGEYYRFLSSGFVHGSMIHLLINMFVFWQFGEMVEQMFLIEFGETQGRINFLLLYFLTLVFADIPSFLKHKDNRHFGSVGASGAVSGILLVYVLYFPWHILYLYFVIPIPGIIAIVLYLVYSSYASKNNNDGIDHSAHFYGAICGGILAMIFSPTIFSDFIYKLINNFPL